MKYQYKEPKPFAYDYFVSDHYTGTNFVKKEETTAPAPYTPVYRPAPAYKPASYYPEPKYNEEAKPFAYDYAVNDHYSGADFAKKEESDGHNTQGYYSVALPDGRVQHVKYVADNYGGYNADVTYEGEAQFPQYHPTPVYNAAAPAYNPAAVHNSSPVYKIAALAHKPATYSA
ncbi:cuticle protein 7-like [Pollicipes pollicipes]|uniref:cuticle protein 7-like n=1 Tax=Pollicipes pollicipes TaxID=41117 RepID=UPI001884BDAE|nr:cuticle protein 7-like [Pollicipes pollicipes]